MEKENTMLIINSFDKNKMLELKEFLSGKNQSAELRIMFRAIDRFLFFIKQGVSICVYFDSNGFNGYDKDNPIYLPNKKEIDFETFKKINA